MKQLSVDSIVKHVLILLVILLGYFSSNGQVFASEYCHDETFDANCANDEVIIINQATFGRMRTGKCISESYAFFMGCSANVLSYMELQCSGRSSCSVSVALLIVKGFRNCTSEFVSYLEVDYISIKVAAAEGRCQGSSINITPTLSTEGYLSSYITRQTGCGNADHPWMLKAGIGQRINITLIDFTSNQNTLSGVNSNVCMVYATIRESDSAITHTVCGGKGHKVIPVFMSASNKVEVKIVSKPKQTDSNDGHFLLKFKVEGCPDPDLPAAMWMRRDAHEALVGCKLDTPTKWILKCVNGIWEGQVGICPAVPASSSGSASASLPAPAPALRPIPVKTSVAHFDNEQSVAIIAASHSEKDVNVLFTKDMLIIIVSLSTVIISLLIFILGIFYLRRKSTIQKYHSPSQTSHLTYGQTVPTLPPSRNYSANTRQDIHSSTLSSFKYYNTAKTSRHPPPPSYEMYPTNRKSVPPAMQTSMYPYSEASSAYNTVNHCQSSKDHIYESTFATSVTVAVADDKENDDGATSEHHYIVQESNRIQSE